MKSIFGTLKWFFVPLVMCLFHPIETTTTTTTTRASTITSTTTSPPVPFFLIQDINSYCNGNGVLFHSKDRVEMKCSCFENYHGLQCQHKFNQIFEKLLFGVGILAGIFLIIAIFLGWQWHSRLSDIDEKKMEIKELKSEKKQMKAENKVLKQRRHSPARSNYAPSVLTSQDDRRSVYSLSMPTYDSMLCSTEQKDTTIKIDMSDDETSVDEIDNKNKLQIDALSIASGNSQAGSESALLHQKHNMNSLQQPNAHRKSWDGSIPTLDTLDNESTDHLTELRKPRANSYGNMFIDSRGYVVQQDSRRSSPNPYELGGDYMIDNEPYRDQRLKAKSLMDLRVVALTTGDKGQKTRSIENLSTGQVHKLITRPNGHNSDKTKGIWARTQQQKMQDSIIGPFSTSAF